MKLYFKGEIEGLEKGIEILSRELLFDISDNGIHINVEKSGGNIFLALRDGEGSIKVSEKIHFFRALGLFVEAARKSDKFEICEEPQFSMNGCMFDVSRNAVLKTESIKILIRKIAVMGLNMMMLYTEDTFELENTPRFGYMRGRYSYEELKECDDYAELFGIDIIPCIQTLAHISNVLKWGEFSGIKDIDDILLVGEEKTYTLIEDMIKAASAPFRSNRIHIGMDEANHLGLGKYLEKNGYKRRFDIITEHLDRVLEITSKYGLKPMMWSDMYFRLGSKTGLYYDTDSEIPKDVIENTPDNLQLVYWDYYHSDESEYRKYIRRHKEFGSKPIFSGGIWTWTGLVTNYSKTFSTTNAALKVCKEEGIKEVFATIWMDNGAENNIFSALLGLQLFAEQGYSKEFDMNKLKTRFKFCTDFDADEFMLIGQMDEIDGNGKGGWDTPPNPSKYILWQDILTGLFDKQIEDLGLNNYYGILKNKLQDYSNNENRRSPVFDVAIKLCNVLELKSEIGIKLKELYDKKDMSGLNLMAKEQLPELSKRVNELRIAHGEQWFRIYKPFGWEVLDIRYGGVLIRIDTAIKRVSEFLEGKIEKIEELEEERLLFASPIDEKETKLIHCNTYTRIVSASDI